MRDCHPAVGADAADLWSLDVVGHELILEGKKRSSIPYQVTAILLENNNFTSECEDGTTSSSCAVKMQDQFMNFHGYLKWAQLEFDGVFVRRQRQTWAGADRRKSRPTSIIPGDSGAVANFTQSGSIATTSSITWDKFAAWVSTDFRAFDPEWEAWCKDQMMGRHATRAFGSQHGQDVYLLWNVFLEKVMQGQPGFYVESGANHWARMSNTLLYDKCLGWKGLCLEPNPMYAKQLQENRSCHYFGECISDKVEDLHFSMKGVMGLIDPTGSARHTSVVHCRPLSAFLRAVGADAVDLWSLDVEGHEMPVLEGIREVSPTLYQNIGVLLIENNKVDVKEEDTLMSSQGYMKWADLEFDGLFIRRQREIWAVRPNSSIPGEAATLPR